MPADPTVPVPGPDTSTWTIQVDQINEVTDSVHLIWKGPDLPCAEWYWLSAWENPDDSANTMPATALDALVADVRAARAHEHCGPATDTLRQALTDIVREARLLNTGRSDDEQLLRIARIAGQALLVDGGGDG
jgi:hypothetical protein